MHSDNFLLDLRSNIPCAFSEQLPSARKRILRSGLCCAASLAVVALSSAACAQSLPQPPEFPQLDENGVDGQTGALTLTIPADLNVGGDSVGALQFQRYYSANIWRNNFSSLLEASQDNYGTQVVNASIGNTSDSFDYGSLASTRNGSTVYSDVYSPGSEYYQLKTGMKVDFGLTTYHAFESIYPDGWQYHIYAQAKSVTFPNGVIWTIHNKTIPVSSGVKPTRIQSVTSNTGYQLKFFYESALHPSEPGYVSGSWGQIVKIVGVNNAYEYCDPSANTCSFTQVWPEAVYSGPPNDTYVTNANGEQTHYTFTWGGTNPSYLKIKTPESPTDNYTYTITPTTGDRGCGVPPSGACFAPTYKVTSINFAGNITDYSYVLSNPGGQWTITRTNPDSGQKKFYSAALALGITKTRDPLGGEALFSRDWFGRPVTVQAPEGNKWEFEYDTGYAAQGNIVKTTVKAKTGSGLSDLIEQRSFGPCAQPTSITDPKGNVTTYEYDATHCGVTKEIGAAVGGVSPSKKFSYTQRYAWYKNSLGVQVQALSPVWLLTEERTCATSALDFNNGTCAAGSSDLTTTTYDYGSNAGPNNLLLRGKAVTSGGVTLRTCYSYDPWGRKISETAPRAGLTTCS